MSLLYNIKVEIYKRNQKSKHTDHAFNAQPRYLLLFCLDSSSRRSIVRHTGSCSPTAACSSLRPYFFSKSRISIRSAMSSGIGAGSAGEGTATSSSSFFLNELNIFIMEKITKAVRRNVITA